MLPICPTAASQSVTTERSTLICVLGCILQAQGTHYFSGSGLLQGGRYVAGGAWQGTEVTAGTAAAVL